MKLYPRWDNLLLMRLDKTSMSTREAKKVEDKANQLQRELHYDLIAFTQTQIMYTIKRLLAADLKHIYSGAECGSGADDGDVAENPFWPHFESVSHPTKGGLHMAPFLLYGW